MNNEAADEGLQEYESLQGYQRTVRKSVANY